SRLFQCKTGVSLQYHIPDTSTKIARPSLRGIGIVCQQRMGDGLGRDECVGRNAAKKIRLGGYAQVAGCRNANECVAWKKVPPTRVGFRGIVLSFKFKPQQ